MRTKYTMTHNQYPLIVFCDTENKYYPRLMEYMGLSFERDEVKLQLYEKFWNYFNGRPNNKVIVALHESQTKKFKMVESFTPDGIKSFVESYYNNELQAYQKCGDGGD